MVIKSIKPEGQETQQMCRRKNNPYRAFIEAYERQATWKGYGSIEG
jgi:hypothetical protein